MNNITNSPVFTALIDLAAERLGGKTISCSDDFFAEKENLIKPGRGIFIADKYTDRGKWMDGWESRRKRTPGHDWCIIKLATSGVIKGVDIDTNHFLGNHPPYASVDASNYYGDDIENISWEEILVKSPLQPGSQNFFEIKNNNSYTHLRLNIYPDGGVARLKVYGEVIKNWQEYKNEKRLDLASALNGGIAIECNDMFFSHMNNLIMPGRGVNMGDGWETKRNRTPGNKDWVILRLGYKGFIDEVLIDTCHFKGNYPDSFMLQGCICKIADENNLKSNGKWETIIEQSKLSADNEHLYKNEIINKGPFTHVRLTIFPDGGISRMRLFGRITD
jgi:allantoicase